jgi:2'-5' RNA ligase
MRCFISIDLPEETRKEIERIQNELPKDARMILVKPEIVHLTLKFLGDITDIEINKIKEILKKTDFKKFKAKLSRLDVFTPSFIKVVYIDIEPKPEFDKIHEIIDKLLSLENFKTDGEWQSHATLSRVKFVKDRKKFFDDVGKIKVNPVEFTVDKISLKKSTLTEKGPVYEDIFSIKLK